MDSNKSMQQGEPFAPADILIKSEHQFQMTKLIIFIVCLAHREHRIWD